jgi:hypothetical protein
MEFYPKLGGMGYILLILLPFKKKTGQTSTPRRTLAPSERPCTEKTGEEETVFSFQSSCLKTLAAV